MSAEPAEDKPPTTAEKTEEQPPAPPAPAEIGGRGGADPTRFGDWEKGGRCIDF